MAKSNSIPVLPLVRIDRNFVHNVDNVFDLFSINGENVDENMLRSLVYYLCFSYQKNLFSYSTIDPYDFAAEMNYTPAFLRQKHPNPLFLQDLKNKTPGAQQLAQQQQLIKQAGRKVCSYDTYFENALYALWKKEVLFPYGATFFNQTEKEEVLTSGNVRFFILRSLSVTQIRSGKATNQEKTVYTVEVDDRFIHSLTKYFIKCNKKTLTDLRKSKLDILYMKLQQLKETALYRQSFSVELSNFETLCRWCGIPQQKKNGEPIAPKKRKQLVITALRTVKEKTDLNFTFEPVTRRGQKFPYTFIITYNNGEEAALCKKQQDTDDLSRLFIETLQRDLYSLYKVLRAADKNPLFVEKAGFLRWMNSDIDREEKKQVYLVASTKIFGKEQITERSFWSRESNFNRFYNEMLKDSNTWTKPLLNPSEQL